MLNKVKEFIYIISIAVIPMAFGSFLFVGVLEKYKNSESLNSAILDSYKTIRNKRSECHKIHNDLFLSYYPYAGSIKIMATEMERVMGAKDVSLPHEYQVFVLSNVESQADYRKDIEELKKNKDKCYTELYISYEELAILLDKIDEYESISGERSSALNGLNSSLEGERGKLKSISADDLMNIFRQGIEVSMLTN